MMFWYPIRAIKPEDKLFLLDVTDVPGRQSAALVLVYGLLIMALAF
jgi:hypothetical protein